jgi:di/tricarboxylate transporter
VGITIKDIGFRSRYDAAVLAVHRAGARVGEKLGEVVLRAGDTLMIEAEKGFDRRWANTLDFALVSRMRAEPLPQPRKAVLAAIIVTLMVLAATFELFPMVVAALLAVGVMLMTGVLTARDAQRSVELSLVLVLAGAMGLGRALDKSGAAAVLAHVMLDVGKSLGPVGTLAAAYICAAILTELITNVAAAAIVFPIAVAAASQAGLDPRPFAIVVAVASSASFITPMGYQTNLMVYGPGGYRFTDFARLGVAVQLVVFLTAMLVVPRVWPL